MSPATKNEIYRIAFEILKNAYRHAHAHRIESEVRYDAHMLRLRIRDDGQGIDPKVLKEGGRAGARLDFWSEAGAGTEVSWPFLLPLLTKLWLTALHENYFAK